MKLFKYTDLLLQLIASVISALLLAILGKGEYLFHLYFFTGGLQVTSFLIHLFIRENWVDRRSRKSYGKTVLLLAGAGLVVYLLFRMDTGAELFFGYAILMLFFSPVLAIWYFTICYSELRSMKHKALVHLK